MIRANQRKSVAMYLATGTTTSSATTTEPTASGTAATTASSAATAAGTSTTAATGTIAMRPITRRTICRRCSAGGRITIEVWFIVGEIRAAFDGQGRSAGALVNLTTAVAAAF